MIRRTVDQSLDVVAAFFESVAATIAKERGLFTGDDFTKGEVQTIVSVCTERSNAFRKQAASYRASLTRGE